MTSIKLTNEVQETSVTFIGFPGGYSKLFRTFTWELVIGTEPFTVSGLRGARREDLGTDLRKLVENALNFEAIARRPPKEYGETPFDRGNYSIIPTKEGFRLYPTSSPKRLKNICAWGQLWNKRSSFLYEGIPRKAQTKKLFPWGFRGVTEEGYRNFRWDKMALMPSETPRDAMTIKLKSKGAGGSGTIYLWVDEAYDNPEPHDESRYLQEVILFKAKQIVSPEAILRRQIARNPTGGLGM
jgi:hypothetical protein